MTPNYNPEKVMLDIETLGTRPGDAIIALGAVKFDIGQGVYSTFYRTVSQESCKEAGLRAQKSTLEFWSKQDEAARKEAFKGEYQLKETLEAFTTWIHPDALVYGNGANFDNVLLSAAYRAVGLEQPWKFWNDRCFRTIKNMHIRTRIERTTMQHHALEDAKHQAVMLIQMAKESGLRLV